MILQVGLGGRQWFATLPGCWASLVVATCLSRGNGLVMRASFVMSPTRYSLKPTSQSLTWNSRSLHVHFSFPKPRRQHQTTEGSAEGLRDADSAQYQPALCMCRMGHGLCCTGPVTALSLVLLKGTCSCWRHRQGSVW